MRAACTGFVACVLLQAADPQAIFEEAAQALRANDLAAAERGFRQVVQQKPSHIGALGNLGVVYSRLERPRDAIAVYLKALTLAPSDDALALNLALVYLKLNRHVDALPVLQALTVRNPAHQQAQELLATCLIFTGDTERGLAVLHRLPESSGTFYLKAIAYLKAGRKVESQKAMDGLLASGLDPARAAFLKGKVYYESTLFDEAARAFESAFAIDPALPGLHRELGKTYVSLRRNADAERELRRAADPESAYFLGALLTQTDRIPEGIGWLEKSRAVNPDFWGHYYYLGKARLQSGEPRTAVTLLKKAAGLNSTEPSIYYQLARALKSAGLHAEAKAATARMTALRNRNPRAVPNDDILR